MSFSCRNRTHHQYRPCVAMNIYIYPVETFTLTNEYEYAQGTCTHVQCNICTAFNCGAGARNKCTFSALARYRYTLDMRVYQLDGLFALYVAGASTHSSYTSRCPAVLEFQKDSSSIVHERSRTQGQIRHDSLLLCTPERGPSSLPAGICPPTGQRKTVL